MALFTRVRTNTLTYRSTQTHRGICSRDCFLPKCLHMLFSVSSSCAACGNGVIVRWSSLLPSHDFNTWLLSTHCERPLSTSCVCVCELCCEKRACDFTSVYAIYLHPFAPKRIQSDFCHFNVIIFTVCYRENRASAEKKAPELEFE